MLHNKETCPRCDEEVSHLIDSVQFGLICSFCYDEMYANQIDLEDEEENKRSRHEED